MINKGDQVFFNIGEDTEIYTAITGEYILDGRRVVDLEGYSGEVAVEYLEILPF